ncbi:MAG: hypothetical protein ABJG15_15735 [Hyphomonadaceae bacterium]
MKRIHRRRHLAIWILLVPIVGFVVWRAITERPIVPEIEALPPSLQQDAG